VLPPSELLAGVYALPRQQVEGSEHSVAFVVDAAFAKALQGKAEFAAPNLFHRCRTAPHLRWIYEGKEAVGATAIALTLDDNGNGFAIVLAASCLPGETRIGAELIESPYTQYTTGFIAEPPREGP
jgi:hypothetical protein